MRTRRVLPPAAAVLALLLAWEAAVRVLRLPPFLLPSPTGVAEAAVRTAGVLPVHVATTLVEAVAGLVVGTLAGAALALLVVLAPRAGAALEPLVLLSQTVPAVVLAPLLVLWAGFGMLPKVVLVALTVFFPVVVAATAALRQADAELLDAVAGLGGGPRDELVLVRLPGAVAGVLAGVRIAATYTVGAAVVAEYLAGSSGLGVYIQRSRAAYAVDQVLVGVLAVALLTAGLVAAVRLLDRRATPWRAPAPTTTTPELP